MEGRLKEAFQNVQENGHAMIASIIEKSARIASEFVNDEGDEDDEEYDVPETWNAGVLGNQEIDDDASDCLEDLFDGINLEDDGEVVTEEI